MTLKQFARMGGHAAAASMTQEQRSQRARNGANARWKAQAKREKKLVRGDGFKPPKKKWDDLTPAEREQRALENNC